jgi:anti-anti-sigma factor
MEMDVRKERQDGILTIFCNGRLDGFGAGKLEEIIRASLHDDDRSIVIVMENVSYLSSGGIRVLLSYRKLLKERNGLVILSGVQEYPRKVLEMAGFTTVFPIYKTTLEAVAAATRSLDRDDLLMEIASPSHSRKGMKVTVESGSPNPATLKIVGSLEDVLHARLDAAHVKAIRFSDVEYSLGLGAMGDGVSDALPLLGEMITLHGSMIWLPTDGNNTPDFFTPARDTGEVKIFTAFNVILNGTFNEVLSFETDSDEGISLSDLYNEIFAFARERKKKTAGIVALVIWGVLAGLESSGIKKSPLRSDAPAGDRSIMDPEFFDTWIDHDTKPRYRGDTIVSFGIGIDFAADLGMYDPELLKAIYYINPANKGSEQLFLHNHGVVFRNVPWDPSASLNQQVKKIVTEGEFIDMRHLLDSTRLRRAKVGVAYISGIIPDTQLRTP